MIKKNLLLLIKDIFYHKISFGGKVCNTHHFKSPNPLTVCCTHLTARDVWIINHTKWLINIGCLLKENPNITPAIMPPSPPCQKVNPPQKQGLFLWLGE